MSQIPQGNVQRGRGWGKRDPFAFCLCPLEVHTPWFSLLVNCSPFPRFPLLMGSIPLSSIHGKRRDYRETHAGICRDQFKFTLSCEATGGWAHSFGPLLTKRLQGNVGGSVVRSKREGTSGLSYLCMSWRTRSGKKKPKSSEFERSESQSAEIVLTKASYPKPSAPVNRDCIVSLTLDQGLNDCFWLTDEGQLWGQSNCSGTLKTQIFATVEGDLGLDDKCIMPHLS